jgi:hypothetical protein
MKDPSLFTRIRWRLDDLQSQQDAKVVVGLVVLVVLALGGVAAARAVANASTTPAGRTAVRVVTLRQKVRVRVHGRLVTRWRTRKVYARPQTVLQTETVRTPNGTRLVTRPVVHYHVIYRKHVITVNGKTRTVMQPVTSSQTVTNTNTKTQVVTSTRRVTDRDTVTDRETVTRPVTVVDTTTVVSTETVPLTVTVTIPTVTAP